MNDSIQFFFHFFNPEILRAYKVPLNKVTLLDRYLNVSRLSFLISNEPILAPVSSIFENPFFITYLQKITPLINADAFRYISPTPDIGIYGEKKIREFHNQPELYPMYKTQDFGLLIKHLEGIKWQPRVTHSASKDITQAWQVSLIDNGILHQSVKESKISNRSISKIERLLMDAPSKLQGKAFVYNNVKPLVPIELSIQKQTGINFLINRNWIESYLEEFKATIIVDSPIGILDFGISNHDNKVATISYRAIVEIFKLIGINDLVESNVSFEKLIKVKSDVKELYSLTQTIIRDYLTDSLTSTRNIFSNKAFLQQKEKILNKVNGKIKKTQELVFLANYLINQENTISRNLNKLPKYTTMPNKTNKVFLVHGRDTKEINTLRSFLKTVKVEIIEWEDAVRLSGNPSNFILEIIKAGFSHAQAAIVLFTPDEEVKLRSNLPGDSTRDAGFQPRPNVLLEAGMAIALFPAQTIIVEMGEPIRQISDLAGIHVIRFDYSSSSQNGIANRLEMAGCHVDRSNI